MNVFGEGAQSPGDNSEGTVKQWSLITVTYNSAEDLRRFWMHVPLPSWVEWIVVDNASTDDSADLAESFGASVYRLSTNKGFGKANNVGFVKSAAPFVLFLNPDVTPVFEDLSKLSDHLGNNPRDLVSPQLVYSDGSLQPNGRGAPRLLNKVIHRLFPSRLDGTYRRFAQFGELVEAEWLIGACVAGVRSHFQRLGPWDERFFVYYEDSDLGLRNQLLRGRSVVLGDLRWTHGWARETSGIRIRPWMLEVASSVKFYSRYPRLLAPLRSGEPAISPVRLQRAWVMDFSDDTVAGY